MDHGRFPSSSSSYSMFNDGSISSCSSFSSPAASPVHSPFESPHDSPIRELQLHNSYNPPVFTQQQMTTLQPPAPTKQQTTTSGIYQQQTNNKHNITSSGGGNNSNNSGNNSNTFVHKLYNMVVDKQYQHLIAWNFTGTSFVVCNIAELSRDVLPKHFKHNNFSSFVRQLNMYGFHKVNKSPRGHRTMAENQIWEFSHCKFMKGRPDLLDKIKRKSIEPDAVRRDNSDLHTRVQMMQSSQASMMQQIAQLQGNFSEVLQELAETRRKHGIQQQVLKTVMDYMTQQQGAQLSMPTDVAAMNGFGDMKADPEQRPPSIYITSPEMDSTAQQLRNFYLDEHYQYQHEQQQQHSTSIPLPLQTHSLVKQHSVPCLQLDTLPQQEKPPLSPSVSMYDTAINTPLPPSPSPSTFMSDDEAASICSPRSPYTPSSCNYGSDLPITDMNEATSVEQDQFQQQQNHHHQSPFQQQQHQQQSYFNTIQRQQEFTLQQQQRQQVSIYDQE